jgi:hypothetical protein
MTNLYHKTITVSDEAFLWQIMTFYPSFWKRGVQTNQLTNENESEIDRSEQTSTPGSVSESSASDLSGSVANETRVRKRGPVKGFKETAGKTLLTYKEYLMVVGKARDSQTKENAKLWSQKLKMIASRFNMHMQERENGSATVRTIAPTGEPIDQSAKYTEIPDGVMHTNFGEDSEDEGSQAVTEV